MPHGVAPPQKTVMRSSLHTYWNAKIKKKPDSTRSYVESRKMIQMNLFAKPKETQRHRERTYIWIPGREGGVWDELGDWD